VVYPAYAASLGGVGSRSLVAGVLLSALSPLTYAKSGWSSAAFGCRRLTLPPYVIAQVTHPDNAASRSLLREHEVP
jgi:hypothetical protein